MSAELFRAMEGFHALGGDLNLIRGKRDDVIVAEFEKLVAWTVEREIERTMMLRCVA